jgi:hypothetical protein
VRVAHWLAVVVLSCGCGLARAASPDAADDRVDATRLDVIDTPEEVCRACLAAGQCYIAGEGGPGTGEGNAAVFLLDAIAAAHGGWPGWRGPPDVGPVEGLGLVRANAPAMAPRRLTEKAVGRVVKRHIRELTYCYEREQPKHPGLSGRIGIQYTISSEGDVVATLLLRSTMTEEGGVPYCVGLIKTFASPPEGGRVANCVAAMMRGWSFPPPNGGAIVAVTQSFDFAPRPPPRAHPIRNHAATAKPP